MPGYNSKYDGEKVESLLNKIDKVEEGANKYIHPEDHAASMIKFSDGGNLQSKLDDGQLGGSIVCIPKEVLNLTRSSTYDEVDIIFGGHTAFSNIVKKIHNGATAVIIGDGKNIIIPECTTIVDEDHINLSDKKYVLTLICMDTFNNVEHIKITISYYYRVYSILKEKLLHSYANTAIIPIDIINLTPESTNEHIIEAFGGQENISNIVDKIIKDDVVATITENTVGSMKRFPCSIIITNYRDINYFDLNLTINMGDNIKIITVRRTNQLFSLLKNETIPLLKANELIADPSTGGANKPASAEAVKVVNDKVATIQGKIDDGSLKGDKGDKGDTGATGPQGPAGPSDWNSIPNMIQGGNEVNFCDNGYNNVLWINHTSRGRGGCNISTVILGNGTSGGRANVEANRFAAPAGFWKESDRRLKNHITPLRHTLDQILAIPTSGFVMDSKQQIGTIAQEIEKICPEVVSESLELKSRVPEHDDWEVFVQNDHEGKPQEYVKVKRVEYEMLGVLALEGVKLLAEEVKELRNQLKQLKR